MKPFKGEIHNWRRRIFDKSIDPVYKNTLGYIIVGIPHGHPDFVNHIYTSAVVKHEGDTVETMNSRYKLVGPEQTTETKISKST